MSEPGMEQELIVDGNAAAGLLQEIFALDVTAAPAECANCGNVEAIGGLVAYVHAPGTVLRCPVCGEVMIRIVRIRDEVLLEAGGTAVIRLGGLQAAA